MPMAQEDRFQAPVLWNLAATLTFITSRFETSHVIKRSLHLSFDTLLFSTLFFLVLAKWGPSPKDGDIPGHRTDLGVKKSERPPLLWTGHEARILGFSLRDLNILLTPLSLLSASIALRMILTWYLVDMVHCSWDGIEIFLPCLLILLDVGIGHRWRHSASRYQAPSTSGRTYSGSYVIETAARTLFIYVVMSYSTHRSTYICPSTGTYALITHIIQCLGLFLDAGIILALSRMCQSPSEIPWRSFSHVTLAASVVLGVFIFIASVINQSATKRLDLFRVDVLIASLLCTNFISCVIFLLSTIRPATLFTIASCVILNCFALRMQSQVVNRMLYVLSLNMFSLAFVSGYVWDKDAMRSGKRSELSRTSVLSLITFGGITLLTTLMMGGTIFLLKPDTWTTHPLDTLLSNAASTSSAWLKQASESNSLETAVLEYQRRYGIPPPPNFDKWYIFATSRGSIILDDFSQIHKDLLPFWGMEPSQIRRLTEHMIERPWTTVVGLRISQNSTKLSPNMLPTHRWMMEGAEAIIRQFAEWIPDMDIALNINDESRVALPRKKIAALLDTADISRRRLNETTLLTSTFSPVTSETWTGKFLDTEPHYSQNHRSEYFTAASKVPSFEDYGTVSCAPDSLARKWAWWDKKAVCPSCPQPHSLGPFIQNWTLSGDVCHQPDIANLHGFHISPSDLKPTHWPMPIFSQSKLPSFSDILFPSPWNYQNKVSYDDAVDIPFNQKESTLFWRGSTSEGFGVWHAWMGMQRQRFVYLVTRSFNLMTNVPLLITGETWTGYREQQVPLSSVLSKTKIDVSFIDGPIRCDERETALQNTTFSFAPGVDFQEHWKYKYLMDLDGAGFSGRFLPFLQSRSLVFRAAAFRQWFDDRLTPWKHFVPVDGRLREVWGLLAYFGGVERFGMGEGHQRAAQAIAEEGRAWAGQVLRKEDMEVYMFRLLLEWGRIIDDRREELGFVLNK